MKKNAIYLLILICSFGLFSCSDDDDKIDSGASTAGTYKGKLTVALGETGKPSAPKDQYIYVTKTGEDLVELAIKDFKYETLPIGDIVIKGIKLTSNGGGYTMVAEETTLELGALGAIKVNITNGRIQKDELMLEIKVLQVSIPLDITVNFTGSKLAGTENKEAKILNFNIDNTLIIGNPVIGEDNIIIYVADSAKNEELLFTPTIEVSASASVSPASGIMQDFSKPVVYTVIAEDGTIKKYTVLQQKIGKYDFENWVLKNKAESPGSEYMEYYEPFGNWATSNQGVSFIKILDGYYPKDAPYAVERTTSAHSGTYAAKIMTLDTKGEGDGSFVPKITSGSLYTGVFDVYKMFDNDMNRLTCTLFGTPYSNVPLKLKGYYKYTPGTEFYNNMVKDETGKTDECSINGVLYEITNAADSLDGTNIYTSDKIVMIAALADGSTKTEWTAFELPFELLPGKAVSSDKKYKLAIIFSSSKDGDKFQGAPGSTLTIDDVEVVSDLR